MTMANKGSGGDWYELRHAHGLLFYVHLIPFNFSLALVNDS